MEINKSYEVLREFQLLDGGGIERVFEIQERYERFRYCTEVPYRTPLSKRVERVIEACKSIEEGIINESERIRKFREELGQGVEEGSREYHEWFINNMDDEDKGIIAQVGKPLNPAPEIDEHPAIIELYKRNRARTTNQKIKAINKEYNDGSRFSVHIKGSWREPKWKVRQLNLRALAYTYLIDRGLIEVNYC